MSKWIALSVLLVALGFSFGRYTATARVEVKEVVKTEQVEHVVTVTREVKKPDGTVITTTHQELAREFKQAAAIEKTTEYKRDAVTISALAAINVSSLSPTYGISVSKPLLGPIAVGAFGFTDGRVGVSVGIAL